MRQFIDKLKEHPAYDPPIDLRQTWAQIRVVLERFGQPGYESLAYTSHSSERMVWVLKTQSGSTLRGEDGPDDRSGIGSGNAVNASNYVQFSSERNHRISGLRDFLQSLPEFLLGSKEISTDFAPIPAAQHGT
jgi:hypothetical protein